MAKRGWKNGGGWAGLAVTLVCLGVLGFLLFGSYRDQARRAPPARPEPEPAAPAGPVAPAVTAPAPPAVGRAQMIVAAASAAAAYAAGAPEPAETPALVGRRFRVRLPFGCRGPAETPATETGASWTYAADGESIRIVVRPETWTQSALIREIGGAESVEAVHGFWIRRPWLRSEDCPAPREDPLAAAEPAASPETVGLAMFFEAGGSRVARRQERPYELVVRRGDETEAAAPRGFRLVLEGRVTGFADGRAFRCRSAHADQRPVCVARVELDSMSVEDPAAGKVLGVWDVGRIGGS